MKSTTALKCLRSLVFASTLSAEAYATQYELSTIEFDSQFGIWKNSYDMENGNFAKVIASNPNCSYCAESQLIIESSNNIEIIVENSYLKDYVGFADGVVFWSEVRGNVSGTQLSQLFKYDGSQVSEVTDLGRRSLLTYDNGQAAWLDSNIHFYDGVNTHTITNRLTDGFTIANFTGTLQLDDGKIAFRARPDDNTNQVVFFWNGSNIHQVSPANTNVTSSDLDNGIVIYEAEDSNGYSQIYQWENGSTTQITYDNSLVNKRIVADYGTIAWRVLQNTTSSGTSDIYVRDDNQSILVSQSGLSDPVVGNGVVAWLEGESGVPSRVMIYQSGQAQVLAHAHAPRSLDIDNVFISWVQSTSGSNAEFILATPSATSSTLIDLGSEWAGKKTIDLSQGDVIIQVSQWSNWSWNPTQIAFGITSGDGQELDGIAVTDQSGQTYPLNDWWSPLAQPFYWQPVTISISAQNRIIEVEWWAQG